jgi:cation:H+ antiporter
MESFSLLLLLLIFALSAGAIWVAGIVLSATTDTLDARLHLGSAFGGLIVLAVATNLPEVAITVSAALSGNVDVAVGNILGGIAIQTVVIAVLDLWGKRTPDSRPLTYRAASLTLVLEALVVVAVLAVVVAGSQLPADLIVARVTPDVIIIALLWIVGLLLVQRAGHGLPWHAGGIAPDSTAHQQGHRTRHPEDPEETDESRSETNGLPKKKRSTGRAAASFTVAAAATLIAGVTLEKSGEAVSTHVGLTGVLFGATVLALATSLPEISTGLQAVRQGDDNLAMSDIFGGNAFLPVLFLSATVLSGQSILPRAHASDIYLTALAALLTLVYAVGLIFRPQRRILGMGVDSLTVVVLYAIGLAGLIAITQ